MQSESARMTTAEEARFRIDYPNSKPRAVKVVALDPPSEEVVKRLAKHPWKQATFFGIQMDDSGDVWNSGHVTDVLELADADSVVVATGHDPLRLSIFRWSSGVTR